MLSTKGVFSRIGLAAGMLAVAGIAHATTITQTFVIPSAPAPFADGFNYNLFNTSFGTLTNVTLELVTASTAEVDVFNSTAGPLPFTDATTSIPLTVSGPPGSTTYISNNITAGPTAGTANPGFNAYPGITGTFDSGLVGIPSANWAGNYEANGNFVSVFQIVVTAGTASSSGSGAPGELFFSGSGNVGGTATLVYTYQGPTVPGQPEPGAWALIVASASVSIAGLRRRRALKS